MQHPLAGDALAQRHDPVDLLRPQAAEAAVLLRDRLRALIRRRWSAPAPGVRRFLVVGESLVDVVTRPDGSVSRAAGGSPLNVAVGLARLGVPTRLVTRIGEDRDGETVGAHLRASGVHVEGGWSAATSTATALLDGHGSASYDFELTWDLPGQPALDPVLGVHVGSLGTVLEPGRAAVLALLAQRPDCLIGYDPNPRPAFVEDPDKAWRAVLEVAAYARLVKLSDEDARLLAPGLADDDVAQALLDAGSELVVLTRGADGAEAFSAGLRVRVPGVPVHVVDTVGAGDSFTAGLLAVLVEWGVEHPAELDAERLERLARAGATGAAVTCSRPGADPPWRSELAEDWP
ncbi:MAG: carbohydrate kinase family protein [Nocardioidaceae bacterium]